MTAKQLLGLMLGAAMLIAAAAGFVIVPEHSPATTYVDVSSGNACAGPLPECATIHAGFTQTVYDATRIATWALLIVGLLVVIVALTSRRDRAR